MSEADKVQIGGGHYKGLTDRAQEHWNVSVGHGWDGLTHTATRYLFRWRNKNGIEDLKKARHVIDKMIELAERGWNPVWHPSNSWRDRVETEIMARSIDPRKVATWRGFTYEGTKDGKDEYTCHSCREHVFVEAGRGDPTLVHGHPEEPNQNYVNQGD